ncbi:iron-sulfur cluster biosynthesis family protein [Alkalicoccus urumqiensis]|uniref:Core domain-containing protein n=1 Tax=Alkalicoccus urumqiensis TaxID=1548213 RepID=A0A2P6MFW7_ALKUR|nr:iron-sulfur cluster biosynthesis family protein [Alkalicoccus urumqiensis]PRO65140.1 hypothetical protein C6I21_11905 [Alkalicoccus urumqiensis]
MMDVELKMTPDAEAYVTERWKETNDVLFIYYSTEETDCISCGSHELYQIKQENVPEDAVFLQSPFDDIRVCISGGVEWLYEDTLQLTYREVSGTLSLQTKNEILSPRMRLQG